mmetsp:Transcript_24224/g.36086  ORF Transcript_24224/g.36086 Transcript_24224/m.36086 type:complete len:516 (+) Transcript_24224:154-1701(+)|eukprot:CAMPEP_0203666310 /NCGR_PEP_ID=MMETSP0090-20130426/3366_1 /ASSEMBLY_ACC=CAM_ASM_001088 /TAXON_ID=426623 /ORGANISM="Chaetoceros affinis, Strain CCMP159" /LENGTH=515 /DNA_ID=CAMNT_0050530151 /DNA_START=98 /DNA_END=1645 /DNA_ORIENTATION=+
MKMNIKTKMKTKIMSDNEVGAVLQEMRRRRTKKRKQRKQKKPTNGTSTSSYCGMITIAIIAMTIVMTQIEMSLSFSLVPPLSSSLPLLSLSHHYHHHHKYKYKYHSCNSRGLYKSRPSIPNIKSSSLLLSSPLPTGSSEEQERNDKNTDGDRDIDSNSNSGIASIGNGNDTNVESEESLLRFQGVGRLYSHANSDSNSLPSKSQSHNQILAQLQKSTVAIIGIGGVGSWAAESICRSGVGNIVLVDLDDVCISNTNRQLHATSSSIGKLKTEVMKERLLDINPFCNVRCIHDFISEENVFDIVQSFQGGNGDINVNVIIDAIDGNNEKAALIAAACIKGIPIVTCGGAAGRIDPSQIICEDLSQSVECKLLFWTKKKLRNYYKLFPNDDLHVSKDRKRKKKRARKWRIPAVYSTEIQKKVVQSGDGGDDNNTSDSSSSSFRKCDGALGTACFVTGTYGMIAAGQAVTMIANDSFPKPRVIRSSVNYWNQRHKHGHEHEHETATKQNNILLQGEEH